MEKTTMWRSNNDEPRKCMDNVEEQ